MKLIFWATPLSHLITAATYKIRNNMLSLLQAQRIHILDCFYFGTKAPHSGILYWINANLLSFITFFYRGKE